MFQPCGAITEDGDVDFITAGDEGWPRATRAD